MLCTRSCRVLCPELTKPDPSPFHVHLYTLWLSLDRCELGTLEAYDCNLTTLTDRTPPVLLTHLRKPTAHAKSITMSSIFGSTAANTNTQGGGVFGNTGQKSGQQESSSSLFGSSVFGSNTNTAAQTGGSSLFGATAARQTPAASLFGGSTAVATPRLQQASSLFGGAQAGNVPAQQPGSLFGASTASNIQQPASQQQQLGLSSLFTRSGGLFGNSTTQPAAGTSLFGQLAGSVSQNAPGQGSQNDTLFEKLQTSRIWTETEPIPRR